MSSTTVRISHDAHRVLRALADRRGQSMQDVLDEALERLRREMFFDELDRTYAAVREDPAAWREETKLREELDQTLLDGLNEYERPSSEG